MKPVLQLWRQPPPCSMLRHLCMVWAQQAGWLAAVRATMDQQKRKRLAAVMERTIELEHLLPAL